MAKLSFKRCATSCGEVTAYSVTDPDATVRDGKIGRVVNTGQHDSGWPNKDERRWAAYDRMGAVLGYFSTRQKAGKALTEYYANRALEHPNS